MAKRLPLWAIEHVEGMWNYGVPTGAVVVAPDEATVQEMLDLKEGVRERTYFGSSQVKDRWVNPRITKVRMLAKVSMFRVPKIILEGESE